MDHFINDSQTFNAVTYFTMHVVLEKEFFQRFLETLMQMSQV